MCPPLRKAILRSYAESILAQCLAYAKTSPRLSKSFPTSLIEPEISVHIVSVREIRALQKRYRQKAAVTDVLSFPTARPFRDHGQLGDIVICGAQLKKQAGMMRHSLEIECAILVVHGFLHLLGYDHEGTPSAARDMRRREEDLLAFLFPENQILSLLYRSGEQ